MFLKIANLREVVVALLAYKWTFQTNSLLLKWTVWNINREKFSLPAVLWEFIKCQWHCALCATIPVHDVFLKINSNQ